MVVIERSSEVITIAKGSAAVADVGLFTAGGAVQTGGITGRLSDIDDTNYKVAINVVHDATGTTVLKYTHAEFTVTRGAAESLDNVVDTTGGATQQVLVFLVDSTPTTDTYLVVIIHL